MALSARRVGLITLPFLVIVIVLHSCLPTFRISSEDVASYFSFRNVKATQHEYSIGGRTFHYVKAGNANGPLVLFVHGSPGSLRDFLHFLADTSLLDAALLITCDRPGFGYSNFGVAEPSLRKQSTMLKPILDRYGKDRQVILVGHSLGGPLIARMAMDYPEIVDGMVMVAGSIDPDLEPREAWFRAPLATPFLSWVLPRAFRASNEEIYQLKPQLQAMIPEWKNITCRVIVIQGKQDRYVPYENLEFARKMLVNASTDYVVIDNMDHFVPWSNPELIRNAILELVDKDSVRYQGQQPY